jgi:beta-lactamase class D
VTLEDLLTLVRARGWQLRAPGHGAGLDNVHVVDRDADGWYVGFLERGELGIMARFDSEEAAVREVHRHLLERYLPDRPRPAGPSSLSDPGRVTTWTVPGRADG